MRQKKQEDYAEKQEETEKRNQMTALRFQTGADIRYPQPLFGGPTSEKEREKKEYQNKYRNKHTQITMHLSIINLKHLTKYQKPNYLNDPVLIRHIKQFQQGK